MSISSTLWLILRAFCFTRWYAVRRNKMAKVTLLKVKGWMLGILMSTKTNFTNKVTALKVWTFSQFLLQVKALYKLLKHSYKLPWLGSVSISEKCCLCSSWNIKHGIKSQAALTANRLHYTAVMSQSVLEGMWSQRIQAAFKRELVYCWSDSLHVGCSCSMLYQDVTEKIKTLATGPWGVRVTVEDRGIASF